MSAPLPMPKKYNPQAQCVKCGAKKVYAKLAGSLDYSEHTVVEIIRRECANCGHKWVELPLDSPHLQDNP